VAEAGEVDGWDEILILASYEPVRRLVLIYSERKVLLAGC
jgi:hypothetical protein